MTDPESTPTDDESTPTDANSADDPSTSTSPSTASSMTTPPRSTHTMPTTSPTTTNTSSLEDALSGLREGEPILLHDAEDREGETDLIYHADAVTPEAVSRLRNDAGGLVCVALGSTVADAFDLPFYDDVVDHPAADNHELGYDDRSSFSFTVNHRDTYTGITDKDRSLTIRSLGDAANDPDGTDFAAEFRVPGHVHLLRAAPELLGQREGHTEFGVALAEEADLSPAVVVCEMLDDQTGEARRPTDAKAYADRHDFAYLEGADVIDRLR